MFERPKSGERAVLVHFSFGFPLDSASLLEFTELARAAGAQTIMTFTGQREKPDPKYFIGQGKLEEIHQFVLAEKIEVILFNHELSPSQERNIEKKCQCRVLSRTGLILDIFAQRARTFEGKLQVELAQLTHLSTRLVRGWTHLERQKGGIGLRGPGETQLESDRRMLRARIHTIESRLEKVRKQRYQGRKQRKKAAIPTVALVGYTNAGKSTVFNRLTNAQVFVANQLFATLDPTLRTIQLPTIGKVVLADTVGFVSNLPHKLVEAFRATLEETLEASLLLHVVDGHSEYTQNHIQQVNEVLNEIGASEIPQLVIYNKIDLLDEPWSNSGKVDQSGNITKVWCSALTGAGFNLLSEALQSQLARNRLEGMLILHPSEANIRAQLFGLGSIIKETNLEDGGWELSIKIAYDRWAELCRVTPSIQQRFIPLQKRG